MKIIVLFIILVINLFANDASYNRGETLYYAKGCNSCHGASAEGSTFYPKLANKKAGFLFKKLQNFKTGKLDSVSKQMMAQFVQKLTIKEIQDLVYYLSRRKNIIIEDVDDGILGGYGS